MKPSCNRLFRGAIVLTMLGLVLIGAAQPAAAAVSSVTLANPGPGTYGEDDDYFTRVWGNPRDMEQASDLYLLYSACNPTQIRRFSNESIANGTWTATTTPRAGDGTDNREVYVLNPGWGSSLNVGEDGQVHPIDAGGYTQLTFRFYASQDIFPYGWVVFTKSEIGSMSGAVPFKMYAGWNVYTIDLKGRSTSWNGGITGLWFNFTDVPSGVTLKLDWLRLTPKASRQIRWTGSGSGSVVVYVGSNPSDANARSRLRISEGAGEAKDIVFGDSPLTVPASFPGDTYRAGVDDGGGVVSSSGAWTFKPVPIAQIVSPSYASGVDWATTVAGNPWDMAGTDDVSAADSENVKYDVSKGVLNITNVSDGKSACDPNWPHRPLGLNLHGLAIDSNKYKYLSFRYRVDQAPNQGAGSVARVRWQIPSGGWPTGRTDDISLYNSDWTVYKLDLSTLRLEVETAAWADLAYQVLQILVNEGHAAWTSHLDWVKLTAENEARGSYAVGWEMVQGQATMATLYWDNDQNPANGFASPPYLAMAVAAPAPSASHLVYLPVIMRNVGAAEHSFALSTDGLSTGLRYYVALKLEDGYNTVFWYSELPVRKIS